MSKSRTVYPAPNHFLADVPAVEHECADPFCVESGAFSEKPPPKTAASTEAPENPGPPDSANKE